METCCSCIQHGLSMLKYCPVYNFSASRINRNKFKSEGLTAPRRQDVSALGEKYSSRRQASSGMKLGPYATACPARQSGALDPKA
ncbi:UNVERIFIED_CONTAM: hypothetical protein Sangu_0774400 [Sesamum angustifolium]|uniref:Uncharacterized protein n=1 Tax=Sesamum angustifolium TaxID=2727405 RepID=A0AAW2PSE1_9LAMI